MATNNQINPINGLEDALMFRLKTIIKERIMERFLKMIDEEVNAELDTALKDIAFDQFTHLRKEYSMIDEIHLYINGKKVEDG